MNSLVASTVLGVLAATPVLAGPVDTDAVNVSGRVGTRAVSFDADVDQGTGEFDFATSLSGGGAGGRLTLEGSGNVDPDQTFGVSFTDVGTSTSVAVSLSTPFSTPFTGLISMFGTGGLTVSDSAGNGGTVSPLGTVGFFVAFDIDGELLLFTGPDPVTYPGSATTVVAFTPVSLVYDCSLQPDGECNGMSSFIGFTGAGGGDTYTFSSGLIITAIPEPVAVAMLGVGILGIGGAVRRRARGNTVVPLMPS